MNSWAILAGAYGPPCPSPMSMTGDGTFSRTFAWGVTKDVTPGSAATVSYQGLFKNKPPALGLGNIVMGSWLVVWE